MRVHLARNQRRRRNVWDGKQNENRKRIVDSEILLLESSDTDELLMEDGALENFSILLEAVD